MKRFFRFVSSAVLALAFFSYSHSSMAATQPEATHSQLVEPSLAAMLQKVMPSVVNISAQGEIPQSPALSQPSERATPRPPRKFESMGSGVIVDAEHGYILTNAHVLRDAQTITVTLDDGRVFKAKMIGMDPPSDIAVLQVKADRLKAANLGDSDALKVGDFVAAIGNPFGLNQTVTSGIVSALQRSNLGIEGYENFIQTDASINPGNSGGALVSIKGQVVGINTAIFSPAGASIGIGFAIPINMAQSVMTQLLKFGSVNRGLVGILVQDFTPALNSAFHLTGQAGALVAQVSPNSPAAYGGVKPGDIVQAVNGQKITSATQVKNAIGLLRVGSHVTLKVLRDNKTVSISLVSTDPQKYVATNQAKDPFLYGITLANFNEIMANLGPVKGVKVISVDQNSMGWHAGLRNNDVITSANLTELKSLDDLEKIAKQSVDQLLLDVIHKQGGAEFIIIKKPEGN